MKDGDITILGSIDHIPVVNPMSPRIFGPLRASAMLPTASKDRSGGTRNATVWPRCRAKMPNVSIYTSTMDPMGMLIIY